ncbi:hypothetical protein GCM10010530_32670 [Kribbella aluminosa]
MTLPIGQHPKLRQVRPQRIGRPRRTLRTRRHEPRARRDRRGVPFTALRNGFSGRRSPARRARHASTPVRLLRSALEAGELIVPEDGPFSWTAHRVRSTTFWG